MKYWKMIILLVLVTTPLVYSSDSPADISAAGIQLLSEPVREAFQTQLFADEWNNEPVTKKTTAFGQKTLKEKTGFRGKSRTKAIILSLLVPGAGEYYIGQKRKARYFFVAEAINIIGFISYKVAADWKRDDMICYGATYAGASMDGKSDLFYDMMGYYTNNEHYNSEGRVGDPWRPYYPDNDEYHWQWQSTEEMATFKSLKDREGQLIQRSKFMLGLAVVNRIVSVIDVALSSRHLKSGSSGEFSQQNDSRLEFSINPTSVNQQVALTWHTSGF